MGARSGYGRHTRTRQAETGLVLSWPRSGGRLQTEKDQAGCRGSAPGAFAAAACWLLLPSWAPFARSERAAFQIGRWSLIAGAASICGPPCDPHLTPPPQAQPKLLASDEPGKGGVPAPAASKIIRLPHWPAPRHTQGKCRSASP